LPPDEVWARLTPDERRKFEELLVSGKLQPPWRVRAAIPLRLSKATSIVHEDVGVASAWRLLLQPWWEDDRNVPRAVLVEEIQPPGTAEETPALMPPLPKNVPPLTTLTKAPPNPALRYNLLDVLYGGEIAPPGLK